MSPAMLTTEMAETGRYCLIDAEEMYRTARPRGEDRVPGIVGT
jgi:hypothetical protein